ncbi:type II secretion system F family protein [uncultured Jatrophihabitans sp.]|uniref:type II secretion system F family protein n=1 Tax=uncultured Jatrophihabitans sp. TaxID=1610747 RepID=UPI0035CA9F94
MGPARGRGSVGNVGPARRLRGGPALAAVLAAVACVVTAGPRVGLVAALVLAPVAGLGVRAAGRRPGRLRTDRSIALPLDLAAAVLRSGRPLADALALAAPAAGPDSAPLLLRVAGLVRLGAGAEDAWSVVPDAHPLRPLAASAVRSAASGIKVADAFERHAAEIRAEAVSAATARAQRAGITAMAPLAACFLPSFVCLGVVPIVVGMATHALGVLG